MDQQERASQDVANVPEDPIVAEVRAIREAQFAAAGYDLPEYVRRLRALPAVAGHPTIAGQPRPAHESAA